MNIMIDYKPSEHCVNYESYGEICVKCGRCGREFDENGVMTKENEA